MSRKRRTEELSVRFVDKIVEGWKFGVGDCFRTQLDIRLDERADSQACNAKRQVLGRPLEPSERVTRLVWTQGDPPAYSFSRGHMFHEFRENRDGYRRTIVVVLSRPDPGSLVERHTADEEGGPKTVISELSEDTSKAGFVDYEVVTYRFGKLVVDENGSAVKERFSRSQNDFVELLKTGI